MANNNFNVEYAEEWGIFPPLFIELNDEKWFEEWILYDWSEQAKIQEYKKELSTTDKKTKNNNDNVWDVDITNLRKILQKKLRNPVNRNYKEPCF